MARIQILELPEGSSDDRPPFVLVVDETSYPTAEAHLAAETWWRQFAGDIGARGCLVTDDTFDIPANDTTAYLADREVTLKLGDQEVRSAVAADLNKMREQAGHAGQRLAGERTDIARDMDRLAKWKQELADALGMNHTRDWDDIRNAAAGIRQDRDAQADALARVRNLAEQPQDANAEYEHPNAYLLGYLNAVREAKRASLDLPATPADA